MARDHNRIVHRNILCRFPFSNAKTKTSSPPRVVTSACQHYPPQKSRVSLFSPCSSTTGEPTKAHLPVPKTFLSPHIERMQHPQPSHYVRQHPTPSSKNMFQATVTRMPQTHPSSKRKASSQLSPLISKKQKTQVTLQPHSYQPPRPHAETHSYPPQAHLNTHPQPLSTAQIFTILTQPLTNVERWRLRGWTWVEAGWRVGGNQGGEERGEDWERGGGDGSESPRGTRFWVEIGREG